MFALTTALVIAFAFCKKVMDVTSVFSVRWYVREAVPSEGCGDVYTVVMLPSMILFKSPVSVSLVSWLTGVSEFGTDVLNSISSILRKNPVPPVTWIFR